MEVDKLIWAAKRGDLEVVKFLFSKDVKKYSKIYESALDIAFEYGKVEFFKLLHSKWKEVDPWLLCNGKSFKSETTKQTEILIYLYECGGLEYFGEDDIFIGARKNGDMEFLEYLQSK